MACQQSRASSFCTTPITVDCSRFSTQWKSHSKRTAAATAVAAKYLARKNSSVATICGCGEQGRAQVRALSLMFPFRKVYAFDIDPNASLDLLHNFRANFRSTLNLSVVCRVRSKQRCGCHLHACDRIFCSQRRRRSGTFIAAVGADDSHKQEIDSGSCRRRKLSQTVSNKFARSATRTTQLQRLNAKRKCLRRTSEIVAGENLAEQAKLKSPFSTALASRSKTRPPHDRL